MTCTAVLRQNRGKKGRKTVQNAASDRQYHGGVRQIRDFILHTCASEDPGGGLCRVSQSNNWLKAIGMLVKSDHFRMHVLAKLHLVCNIIDG